MKKILCFGDSNTFGFNPKNGKRYDEKTRWTGILKSKLKDLYIVQEAGCNNRTAFSDNPSGENFTGYKALKKHLTKDFDILILSIGINDLQKIYQTRKEDYKQGINNLIKIAKEINPKIEILLTSPSLINENILQSYFSELFDESSIKKSKDLFNIYKEIAYENNCYFLDLEQIAKTSKHDGLHYDEDGHKKIAQEISNIYLNF